ncbi:TPA: hypothetical protein IW703_002289 [Enterococcus faecium]|nr:hypothetical protein [Enterococcus faecium]EKC6798667.1 hypothetical protein [Enterococcus faecium]EKY7920834.1 hypothetical protein [Enterococcus faecium]EKY7946795.1 hypothetical protein [Enterococcus faecium]KAB7544738.1 hypothetical protein GBM46_15750 [Enterococcus faecium]
MVNKPIALVMGLVLVLFLTSCSKKQEIQKTNLIPFLGTWQTKDHSERLVITNLNTSKNIEQYTILVKENNHKIQIIDKNLNINEQVFIYKATNNLLTLRSNKKQLDYTFSLDSPKKLVFILTTNDGTEGTAKPIEFFKAD